jgi:hypothetical protein
MKIEIEVKKVNDRPPNFTQDGKFYLVRCFVCDSRYGRENWAMAVASGKCCWCGWSEGIEINKL